MTSVPTCLLHETMLKYISMTNNVEFPLTSKTGKRYKLDGNVRVYESGAQWSEETGRLVAAPPDKRITTENTSEFTAKRLAKQREENDRQVLRAIEAIATEKISSPDEALGYILAQQATLAASPDLDPKASTTAAKLVFKETGRDQRVEKAQSETPSDLIRALGEGIGRAVMDEVLAKTAVDAEYEEVEE